MSAEFRWSIATAIAAVASLAGPPAIAAPGDPVAFAKTLYAQPKLWMSIVSTPDSRAQYLTLQLTPLVGSNRTGDFKSAMPYDPLAYDLVANGGPSLLSDETFTLVGSDDDGTSVKVDFKNNGNPDTVTLELVSSDDHDRWLLADIEFPYAGETLLKVLQPACGD